MSGRHPVGMPDMAAGDYAVAKAERLDGVPGFEIVEMSEEHAVERFPVADRVRQRFVLVYGGAYAAMAEMLATEATVLGV